MLIHCFYYRFHAHEEFIRLVGKAFIIEAAKEYFGLKSQSDSPTIHAPPPGIDRCHRRKRTEVFEKTMTGFLEFVSEPMTFRVSDQMVLYACRRGVKSWYRLCPSIFCFCAITLKNACTDINLIWYPLLFHIHVPEYLTYDCCLPESVHIQ